MAKELEKLIKIIRRSLYPLLEKKQIRQSSKGFQSHKKKTGNSEQKRLDTEPSEHNLDLQEEMQHFANQKNFKNLLKRYCFSLNEQLNIKDDWQIKYINHYWPFKTHHAQFHIQKSICGLLNSDGGYLVFGVDAENKVVGMQLNQQNLKDF